MQLTSCQEESLSGSDLAKVARTNLIGLLERTDSLAKAKTKTCSTWHALA